MNSEKCYIEGCSLNPRAQCLCKKEHPILLCDVHAFTHMEEDLSTNHQIIPLFAKLSKEENSLLSETLESIDAIKTGAINLTMKAYQRAMLRIKETYSRRISKIIESINPFVVKLESAIATNKTLRSSEDNFIRELSKTKDLTENNKKYRLITLISKTLEPEVLEMMNIYSQDCSPEYAIQPNSRSIKEIDLTNLTHKINNIEHLQENFGYFAGICLTRTSDIFYCGGLASDDIKSCRSSCLYVDVLTQRTEQLPDMPDSACKICPSAIGDDIYVFGGQNNTGSFLSTAWKYSEIQRQWISLNDMPVPSENVTSIPVNNSILLSGYQTSGIYQCLNSKYTKILHTNCGYGCLLKTNSGDLYFLINGKIHRSCEKDYKNWKKSGSYDSRIFNECLASCPRQHGDYFIIVQHSGAIIKFNYKTLNFEKLKLN